MTFRSSEGRDLEFLDFKDEDSDSLRSMKAEWQLIMSMPPAERKVFMLEQQVEHETHYLEWMIATNKEHDQARRDAAIKAKRAMIDYEQLGDPQSLAQAEAWTQMAQSWQQSRFSLQDIRKQREVVQWRRKRLAAAKTQQPSDEQSTSSNHSKS